MNSMLRTCALAAPLALALAAHAEDLGQVSLFGQAYDVQRFDYTQIVYDNPMFPGFEANLAEVESTQFFGGDRLLLASDGMDVQSAPKNLIAELRLVADNNGRITGLESVRVVAWIDPSNQGFGGYDLDPAGATINTGKTGLGAGGGIVIGSSSNFLAGFDFATGDQIEWLPGCGGLGCTIDISGTNASCEDIVYVAPRDELYTIMQDPPFSIQRYATDGTWAGQFLIAEDYDPSVKGDPKGIAFLPGDGAFPALFDGRDTILAILDDEGPALQAFDLDGGFIAYAPLADQNGDFLLDPAQGDAAQQVESGSADPATGRLFLTIQSDGFTNGYTYILTPVGNCYADFTGDSTLDLFDFLAYVNAFNAGDAAADCDHDDTLTLFDFLCFVNAFNEGC